MNLTDPITRLAAGAAFGAVALLPALGVPGAAPAGADPGDDFTTPTTDPCHEWGTCPPPEPCDPEVEICEWVPCLLPGTCPPPPVECDPDVEQCDDDPDPDPDDPDPVDPPVVARPTFTG